MLDQKIREQIKGQEWYKIYAGNWSILSLSHFADEYTDILDFEGRKFVQSCVLVYRDGACSGYVSEAEKTEFAQYIAKLYSADTTKIEKLIPYFQSQADNIIRWMADHQGQKFNLELWAEFLRQIDTYYVPHIINKWMVESLDPVLLEKYLPGLEEARLHAEPVFKRTEELVEEIATQIASETGKTPELILALTKAELANYWRTGELPSDQVLQERRGYWAVVHLPGVRTTYQGVAAGEIESLMAPQDGQPDASIIKGTTAYPGKVVGTVKIILDPRQAAHFNEGDILVAGMTRPEYLALMQKAAAFVTDSGGILSHAAIVARELKKPCVIGTQIATKQLRDGMEVEVDATQGVVKIVTGA